MAEREIVVGVNRPNGIERVYVTAGRVDRDRDGVVRCYDSDGEEIATFYDAAFAVAADHEA